MGIKVINPLATKSANTEDDRYYNHPAPRGKRNLDVDMRQVGSFMRTTVVLFRADNAFRR